MLPAAVTGPAAEVAYNQIAQLGTSTVVIDLLWKSTVSPAAAGAVDFDPRDPGSPYYDWSAFDDQARAAKANGLSVIGLILDAPAWALDPAPGSAEATLPDPADLADFAVAAARRYDGTYGELLKVNAWEVWNEPNISLYLEPQFVNGQPFAPDWYRTMLNTYYDAVKAVVPDVLIVGGGTAPFYDNTPEVGAIDPDWGPLSFMRHLFCLSDTLQPTCSTSVKMDVWAHHPYTEGSPSRRASLPNDVSLVDLPKVNAVLQAAQKAGNIVSSQPLELWVPEFSWDSGPPDEHGVPASTLLRWVPQSLHDMWQNGVSVVDWFTLYDQAPPDLYQSGLLYEDQTAKPHAQPFVFPVVGTSRRSQLEVWGRTPGGQQATVTIQRSVQNGWEDLGQLTSDANGIFQGRFSALPTGSIRAVASSLGVTSAAYPLGADPEVNTVYPIFGGPLLEPPPTWSRPAIPQPPSGGTDTRIATQIRLRGGTG